MPSRTSSSSPALAVVPQSEKQFQQAVVDFARRSGWMAYHANDSRREVVDRQTGARRLVGDPDAIGYPDWTFVRERIVWAELKRRDGQLRPEQRAWLDALRAAGGEAYVWTPEDWPTIERVLARDRSAA